MAIAEQRSYFGVLHYTANSGNGERERKWLTGHIAKRLGGWLAKDHYFDDNVGRYVSEHCVPVMANRTCHGLAFHFNTLEFRVKGKSSFKTPAVEVAPPGRGSVVPMAQGCGTPKPGLVGKLTRKKFKDNRVILNDMARTKLLLAVLQEIIDANPGCMRMPLPHEACGVAWFLLQQKLLDDDTHLRIERILQTEADKTERSEPDYGYDVGPLAIAPDLRTAAKRHEEISAALANDIPLIPTTTTGPGVNPDRQPTWSEDHGQKN